MVVVTGERAQRQHRPEHSGGESATQEQRHAPAPLVGGEALAEQGEVQHAHHQRDDEALCCSLRLSWHAAHD